MYWEKDERKYYIVCHYRERQKKAYGWQRSTFRRQDIHSIIIIVIIIMKKLFADIERFVYLQYTFTILICILWQMESVCVCVCLCVASSKCFSALGYFRPVKPFFFYFFKNRQHWSRFFCGTSCFFSSQPSPCSLPRRLSAISGQCSSSSMRTTKRESFLLKVGYDIWIGHECDTKQYFMYGCMCMCVLTQLECQGLEFIWFRKRYTQYVLYWDIKWNRIRQPFLVVYQYIYTIPYCNILPILWMFWYYSHCC